MYWKYILAIITYNTSKENSTLAITAFITSKLNWFWFITRYPYMKKMVFCFCHLQTKFVLIHQRGSKHVENSILAIIDHCIQYFKRKLICFDASHNVPTCGKQYCCNHCIQDFKRKFILMHHKMSQDEENPILAITAYNS